MGFNSGFKGLNTGRGAVGKQFFDRKQCCQYSAITSALAFRKKECKTKTRGPHQKVPRAACLTGLSYRKYCQYSLYFKSSHDCNICFTYDTDLMFMGPCIVVIFQYSKTCLKRNAIVPVFFLRFHRFPFYKGLCFNKTKYQKYDRLGLQ